MKKYVQSFRLFFGVCQMRTFVIFTAVIIGFTALCAVFSLLPTNDFLAGFSQGVSSMMGTLCAVFGIMFLNALFQFNSPATPGNKYYHSIPDGAAHFRRAIAAGNVLGIVVGLALLAIVSAVYLLIGMDTRIIIFSAALLFLATGVCDLTGFIRSTTARIIALMCVICLFGFTAGFLDGAADEEDTAADLLSQYPVISLIICGVSIAVFAAGLIYALVSAEKKWGEAR